MYPYRQITLQDHKSSILSIPYHKSLEAYLQITKRTDTKPGSPPSVSGDILVMKIPFSFDSRIENSLHSLWVPSRALIKYLHIGIGFFTHLEFSHSKTNSPSLSLNPVERQVKETRILYWDKTNPKWMLCIVVIGKIQFYQFELCYVLKWVWW